MRSVYLSAPERVEVREVEDPAPGTGQVLVRIRRGGICGSDLYAYRGDHVFRKPPVVLGHEGAGEVVRSGEAVDRWEAGDRVAIEPQAACGTCRACRSGRSPSCPHRKVAGVGLPGFFSDFVSVPERLLHRVPYEVPWDEAALVEPTAVAHRAVSSAGIREDSRVAVLGAGPIGALTALVCERLYNVQGVVADVKRLNLDLVQHLTGWRSVDLTGVSTVREIFDTDEERFDTVFVANSDPSSLADAVAVARPGARIMALAATYLEPPAVDVASVVLKELDIRGTLAYTSEDFSAAIGLIAGGLEVGPLVTHIRPVEEAPALFDWLAGAPDHVKALLTFA